MNKYFVYIIQCQDGSLYTGYSTEPVKRFYKHLSGKGAKYTRSHKPQLFVFIQKMDTKVEALKFEYKIKSLTRTQKIKLIQGCKEAQELAKEFNQEVYQNAKIN